ncbi:hypothetical protein OF83DRAFT_1142298 [Amylostereum chailletii]|nr:hypothetical protein OF83DRAFT_1142298 [Amylostereum chailletii]
MLHRPLRRPGSLISESLTLPLVPVTVADILCGDPHERRVQVCMHQPVYAVRFQCGSCPLMIDRGSTSTKTGGSLSTPSS